MGDAKKGHGIGWMATLLGLALALGFGVGVAVPLAAVSRKPVKPKTAPVAAQAPLKTTLPLDTGAYYEAHKSLDSGNLDNALQRFCDAMAPVRSVGYTLNLALLSDPSSVGSAVRGLRGNRKEPIFVVRKIYRGTPCYGLLLGLYSTKGEAAQLASSLPATLRKARPYPAALSIVSDLCLSHEPQVQPGERGENPNGEPADSETPPGMAPLPSPPPASVTGMPGPAPPATEEPAPLLVEDTPLQKTALEEGFPFQPQPAPVLPESAEVEERTATPVPPPIALEPTEKKNAVAERAESVPPPPSDMGTQAPTPVLEVSSPPAATIAGAQKDLRERPAYKEAHRLLAAGSLDASVDNFCKAVEVEPASAWSLSIILICEPNAVGAQVASLKAEVQEPVFILPKYYQDAPCYRLCIGVRPDRRQATLLRSRLPEEWAKAGPFPFPLRGVCEPILRSNIPSPPGAIATVPESPSPEKTPETREVVGPVKIETAPSLTPLAQPVIVPHFETPVPTASPKADLAPPQVVHPSPPKNEIGSSKGSGPDPIQGEEWFRKGLQAQAKGQTEEAIEAYEKALESQPEKPEVLNNLGVLYLQKSEFGAARDLLSRAVLAAPGYGRARLNLAGALWGLGERDAAMEQARTASILNSGDASAHLTLASFLVAVGRKEEAIAEAKVVLALEPGNRQAEHLIADLTK